MYASFLFFFFVRSSCALTTHQFAFNYVFPKMIIFDGIAIMLLFKSCPSYCMRPNVPTATAAAITLSNEQMRAIHVPRLPDCVQCTLCTQWKTKMSTYTERPRKKGETDETLTPIWETMPQITPISMSNH